MFSGSNFFCRVIIFALVSFPAIFSTADAQNLNTQTFQYVFPVPGSKLNSTETNIIIKPGETFNDLVIDNSLVVTGSKSGIHNGKIILAENKRTLIFKPYKPFADGETVTIKLNNILKTVSGKTVPELQYSFETSKVNLIKAQAYDSEEIIKILNPDFDKSSQENEKSAFTKKTYTVQSDNLPTDFPVISVDIYNTPTPGYIFLAPFSRSSPNAPNYLIITDNYGVPVYYKKMVSERTLDFTKQTVGTLTYFNGGHYYIMDSSYNVIDTVSTQNGYETDEHECLLLGNGHTILMSYDHQQVAMDTVISGGDPNADVIGLVVQELDEDKNVVFQWRSWDHFKITDATHDINLTASTIDYAHGNAVAVDYDGNLLISSRNLDEITKINRQTGEIIWRWGGQYCENNQFTFLNDPIGFSHQHHIRKLANGNYTLFDNGNLHSPQFSRAVEYQLDEENKTARLIREYANEPETFSLAMGNNQRLEDQSIFIGWGWASSTAATEVSPEGTLTLNLSIPSTMVNYRGFKFSWKTNLFTANPGELSFGIVHAGDSLTKTLTVTNSSNKEIEINGTLNRDPAFYVNTSLPVIIPAAGTADIEVTFKPEAGGNYSDDLHLQWNITNERIAQVVSMYGVCDKLVPVELSSFTASANEKSIILTWITETETNNHLFEIERQKGDSDWHTIGFVNGKGTTTKPTNYSYTDNDVQTESYSYRLKQIDFNGSFRYSDVINIDANIPGEFSLGQNYPNPFNPTTKINFTIPKEGNVSLKIYDMMGCEVGTLISKKMKAGEHEIEFNAKNLPSGVYIYTLKTSDHIDSEKMVLLK